MPLRISGSCLWQMLLKNTQNGTFLLIRDSYGGYRPVTYTFRKLSLTCMMQSSNWHLTLRLTVFEIFAVKWLSKGPKTYPSPFLVLHSLTPEDVVAKREEDLSGWAANVHADRSQSAEMSVTLSPNTNKQRHIIISDKTHTSVAFVG